MTEETKQRAQDKKQTLQLQLHAARIERGGRILSGNIRVGVAPFSSEQERLFRSSTAGARSLEGDTAPSSNGSRQEAYDLAPRAPLQPHCGPPSQLFFVLSLPKVDAIRDLGAQCVREQFQLQEVLRKHIAAQLRLQAEIHKHLTTTTAATPAIAMSGGGGSGSARSLGSHTP